MPQVSQTTDRIRQNREAIEAMEPATATREWKFNWTHPNGQPIEMTYYQEELGLFPAQEFVTIITEILDSFVDGEMGMKIGDLFRGDVKMPVTFDAESVNSVVEDNMQLIKAIVKLVQILPEFQLDIICLSLGVPRKEREWAKTQLSDIPKRGGLTVTDGFDILKYFIQQNASLVKETFLGKARELVDVFRLEILDLEPTSPTDSTAEEEEMALSSPGGTPSSTSSPDIPESL